MAPHLEIQSGHALGLAFALTQSPVTLGRDPTSAIRLDDLSVSTRHAVLQQRGTSWTVVDYGSTNGTFVKGERLAPQRERELAEGDVIQFGQIAAVYTNRQLPDARMASWYAQTPAPSHAAAPPLASRPSAAAAPPVAARPSAAPARRCVSCGAPLAADARFCTGCGFAASGGAA